MDISVFRDRRIVALTAAILAAAVLSKFAGCGLGMLGMGRAAALRVGVGMVPRGEVGMVVAQLGLTLGAIDKPVYGVVVLMSVATTLIAPPLLKLAYRGVEGGRPAATYDLG